MHRQDLRPPTNSSFSGIVNWQEHIKFYAYCWSKHNWEGCLEHLTCFCPKTNVFWAKITKVMTKDYIHAFKNCYLCSRVAQGEEISVNREGGALTFSTQKVSHERHEEQKKPPSIDSKDHRIC